MIRAVLFDFEGVIAAKTEHKLSEQLAKNLEIPRDRAWELLAPEQHDYIRGLIDEATLWLRIEQRFGKPVPASARNIWLAYGDLNPLPAMVIFARQLKKDGIAVGILSNVIPYTRDAIRLRNGYDGFWPVLLSCEIGLAKPDAEVYNLALDMLQLQPREVLFIDDNEANLALARLLGMHTLLAATPDQTIAQTMSLIEQEKGRQQ